MNHENATIDRLFKDYRAWCEEQGIPPEPYEVFYNHIMAIESHHDNPPLTDEDQANAVDAAERILRGL